MKRVTEVEMNTKRENLREKERTNIIVFVFPQQLLQNKCSRSQKSNRFSLKTRELKKSSYQSGKSRTKETQAEAFDILETLL